MGGGGTQCAELGGMCRVADPVAVGLGRGSNSAVTPVEAPPTASEGPLDEAARYKLPLTTVSPAAAILVFCGA